MRSKNINFLSAFLFCFLLSCNYVDILGLLASSPVDDRFKMKNNLKDFTACSVPDPYNFSFLVIADTHYYEKQTDYFRKIEEKKNEWGISFVVLIGDIVQSGLSSSYNLAKNDISSCTLPVYPAIGNHDLYNSGFDQYKNFFGRTIYNFKIGSTDFIFLDSANGTLGNYQRIWLEQRLKESKAGNILIFSHYSPTDNEFQTYVEWSYSEEKYYLFDLFDTCNVDYYFCGHLHNNDEKEIRGVKYIVVKNISSGDNDVFMKVTVNSSGVNTALQ